MGKQKYPSSADGLTVDGERKQRDHTKTGKLQKRRETRRLEAIARQVENIRTLEQSLEKTKNKEATQDNLLHAQLTLQKIRGGVPHIVLNSKYKTTTTPKNEENTKSQ